MTSQKLFDPRYRRLVSFFALELEDLEIPHVEEKLMFIWDFAEEKAKSNDLEKVMSALNSFKKSFGTQQRGIPLLKDLYRDSRLAQEKVMSKKLTAEEAKTKREADRQSMQETKSLLDTEKKQKKVDEAKRRDTTTRAAKYFQKKLELKSKQSDKPKPVTVPAPTEKTVKLGSIAAAIQLANEMRARAGQPSLDQTLLNN